MPEPKFLTDNIPHEYILLPNVKHAFDPEGVGLNWSLEECEFKKGSNQYISICYYVKDTNYAVVDIDTDDYSLDQLFEDTEIDSMWVKGNTTGFHVWVEFPNGKPDAYRRTEQNCSNLCKMDFLGEKVWERLDKHGLVKNLAISTQNNLRNVLICKNSHQKRKQKRKHTNLLVTKSCLQKWWI